MRKLIILWALFMGLVGGLTAQEMPTVTIVTDGPIVNTPAVHGTITVDDHNGTVIQMHAGFKIRGTSSQQYDKKSYRVELWTDETGTEIADTTFLGLRSDDDWNLEAMWAQPLRLRDKVANELWMEMYQLPYLENEPTALPGIRMEYVDLYVNETFMGVYALTERMDRKQLGLRKYNGNIRGLLFKGNGNGAPTFDTLPGYDNSLDTWDNYEWVYPNESDTVIDWSSLYNFTNFVMNASDVAFYSQYSTMFDADNAADYFIFINVLKAMDNMGRNLFVARYKKTSTFFYAPWDLDAIWGLDTDGNPTASAEGILSNGFFDRLRDDCSENGFSNKTRDRYNALRETVLNREHIMDLVREQYQALVDCGAYDHEHEAWPEFTVDESLLDVMSNWLDTRFAYLDVELNATCGTWDVEEVEEEQELYGETTIRVYDMMGRLVRVQNNASTHSTIDGLPSGIYIIVTYTAGHQQVDRVFVNH
ncbi:MAG: CotH kinase family protein [Bacteroidales bacterium]|nr:CotH kinase family protein [Bacteroidales bacterium]